MKLAMTRKNSSAGSSLLCRAVLLLFVVSSAASALLTNLAVANGATTSTTSTTADFVVSSDRPNYTGSATIVVTGVAPSGTTAVTVSIQNPARATVAAAPATVGQDGGFMTTFQAGGSSWNASGKYTVVAVVQQFDTVAPAPRTNSSFFYTALVTTTSAAVSLTTSPSGGVDTSSIASVLGIAGVIVVAVAIVGFMLRSRGHKGPPTQAP